MDRAVSCTSWIPIVDGVEGTDLAEADVNAVSATISTSLDRDETEKKV